MDFARKQLEKYGWIDGKGLGKHENGIAEALRPKLKRSVAGVGHDASSDFTDHWWQALYNKAANNVQVIQKNGKTKKIKTLDDSNFEITNSTWKIKKKNKDTKKTEDKYDEYFVKKAVLTSGGAKTEKLDKSDSEEEVVEKKDVFKMTDEELFAACEGRTAHKGARHGLKALGKLARIEQQEQQLLDQSKYEGYSHKKRDKQRKVILDNVVDNTGLESDDNVTMKKKKEKKRCKRNNLKINDHDEYSNIEVDDTKTEISEEVCEQLKKSKKKKRKICREDSIEENMGTDSILPDCEENDQVCHDKKLHKSEKTKIKKKLNNLNLEDNNAFDVDEINIDVNKSVKRKKNKRKHSIGDDKGGNDEEHDIKAVKKSKYKMSK